MVQDCSVLLIKKLLRFLSKLDKRTELLFWSNKDYEQFLPLTRVVCFYQDKKSKMTKKFLPKSRLILKIPSLRLLTRMTVCRKPTLNRLVNVPKFR
jgi:hypothetical protein